jgi:Trk-type K+ transport system membrane component
MRLTSSAKRSHPRRGGDLPVEILHDDDLNLRHISKITLARETIVISETSVTIRARGSVVARSAIWRRPRAVPSTVVTIGASTTAIRISSTESPRRGRSSWTIIVATSWFVASASEGIARTANIARTLTAVWRTRASIMACSEPLPCSCRLSIASVLGWLGDLQI